MIAHAWVEQWGHEIFTGEVNNEIFELYHILKGSLQELVVIRWDQRPSEVVLEIPVKRRQRNQEKKGRIERELKHNKEKLVSWVHHRTMLKM